MEIVFLGTSGAVATRERDNTSLLIKEKKKCILIDVPGAVVHKLKKLEINYFNVNDIFITHIHPDHIYGLPSFIHARMFDEYSTINIYGQEKSLEFVRELLKLFNLRRRKFPRIKLHKFKIDSTVSLFGYLCVTVFKTRHSPESLGIKIKYGNKTIIYTSDTAYFPEIIKIAKNCDYLIHDCFAPERFFKIYPQLKRMHSSPKTVAEVYTKAGVVTLIPIHFSGELNFRLSEISEELRKLNVKNFIIPQDLQKIKINYK